MTPTNPGLAWQVAVVTGGGRGIGEVIDRTLAAAGVKVGLLRRDGATLHRAGSAIDQTGRTSLVNNASQADSGNVWETDPESW